MHFLLWLDNAPKYKDGDVDSANKVTEFVDRFVTTKNDNLAQYQIHKHSSSCIRRKKTKKNHRRHTKFRLGNDECRFNIPFLPARKTVILSPLPELDNSEQTKYKTKLKDIKNVLEDIRANRESPTFDEFLQQISLSEDEYLYIIRANLSAEKMFLKRDPDAAFVNGYNPHIQELFRSNSDIQFCLNPYSTAKYITNYINKGKSLLVGPTVWVKISNNSVEFHFRSISGAFEIAQRYCRRNSERSSKST